jgi:hypothetical protein
MLFGAVCAHDSASLDVYTWTEAYKPCEASWIIRGMHYTRKCNSFIEEFRPVAVVRSLPYKRKDVRGVSVYNIKEWDRMGWGGKQDTFVKKTEE